MSNNNDEQFKQVEHACAHKFTSKLLILFLVIKTES